ncbi:Uncharacterised protein [Mycobacteroides abscessus subsp. massiliense]|uniref:hypothetical protein n=1 Tax=Mycobacteroides abscessus TaxID=36809 RepID=UPI0009A67795|nr:hypothetical protein [Mycobacteroides abscessus]SLE84378.1 Uncharacterised protein [Mycobacteroides abscessus subsp. massiliense]
MAIDKVTGTEDSAYVRCVKDLIVTAQAVHDLDSTPSEVAFVEALDQLGLVGSEAVVVAPLQSSIDLAQRIIDAITNLNRPATVKP